MNGDLGKRLAILMAFATTCCCDDCRILYGWLSTLLAIEDRLDDEQVAQDQPAGEM